jgi:hypothetical protein
VLGSCEHGNDSPGTIKCWEFLSRYTIAASQEVLSSVSKDAIEPSNVKSKIIILWRIDAMQESLRHRNL